jgi:hypothetical protein
MEPRPVRFQSALAREKNEAHQRGSKSVNLNGLLRTGRFQSAFVYSISQNRT